MFRIPCFYCRGAWVQSLVGDLRSCTMQQKKKERNLSKALSDHTSSHCDSDKASLLSSVLDLEGPFWQGSKEALICGERSPFTEDSRI